MAIKIKHRDPKSTDFSSKDIIINVKEGSLFYKDNKDLYKVQGDKIITPSVESNLTALKQVGDVLTEISASSITASGNISASGFISASSFSGDGSGLTNVTATATVPAGTISSSLQNLGNITGSNVSASGTSHVFGGTLDLIATDPRLRLKAIGANHPGIEWHEDSTRKWVVYNDPDESDKLVFKNDTTELLKLTQNGHLGVTEEIYHIGDTDTKITFTTDDINITVGGVNMIDFTEGSNDEITINEAAADLDVRIEGEDDPNLLFVDATTPGRVGIGTNTPGEKLEVAGAISASGNSTITGNTGSFGELANFKIGGTEVTSNNVTVNRDLIVNRNIDVASAVVHKDDIDTKMTFGTDSITFDVGSVEMLKFTEGGLGNIIVVNEDGADTNFRIESSGNAQMLFVDGGTNKVGIAAGATPSKTLTVGGDISASGEYFGKWKTTSTHAFYVTNASVNFVPMAASLNESSIADSYYHRNIAPYDGRLVRVMLVCQNNDPGNVSVGLTTGSGALGLTKDNGEICTIAGCVDDTSYTFDFTGSSATFNKGEDIGIQFQQSNAVSNGTYITCVWEYDSGGT